MKILWFGCGVIFGFTVLTISFASVPSSRQMRVTDDTAIYQKLSEITTPKAGRIDFDKDIARLSVDERRYHEALPQLKGPMKRVAQRQYKYAGHKSATASK